MIYLVAFLAIPAAWALYLLWAFTRLYRHCRRIARERY